MALNLEVTEFDLERVRHEFESLVRKGPACWRWCGGKYKGERGCLRVERAWAGDRVHVFAHRLAVYFFTGRLVKPDEDVVHGCRNEWCVNPDHLRVIPNPRRLTIEDARAIRADPRESDREVAADWGVRPYVVYQIRRNMIHKEKEPC